MFLFISACNTEEEQNNFTQNENEQETSVQVEEKSIYPLTGLKTADGDVNRRPVAVMINNHPKARPQSGLHKADIVYEALAEGNITRFLAVFQSDIPDVIGPVRSAREYFIDLSKGFDALYIHHGWSPSAKEKLESGEADYLNGLSYDGTLFWRTDNRKAPHNSYISYKNILKGAKELNYSSDSEVEPYQFLSEEEMELLKGERVNKFVIEYDKLETWQATYEYNQTNNSYSRYSDDELTFDMESGEPITISNVFVVEMEHDYVDNYGRRSIDVQSGGKAVLLQGGIMQEVEWENREGRIVPVKDGEVIKFVPGKTWINIVPSLEKSFFIE